jgi:hypothetical protein
MNRLEVLNPHENHGNLEPAYSFTYSEAGFSGKVIIPGQAFIIGVIVLSIGDWHCNYRMSFDSGRNLQMKLQDLEYEGNHSSFSARLVTYASPHLVEKKDMAYFPYDYNVISCAGLSL